MQTLALLDFFLFSGIESTPHIYFDMWKAYKVDGMQVLMEQKNEAGEIIEVPYQIPYEVLKRIEPYIRVDITPKSPYDRYAEEQSLENLFMSDKITFEEYVEALPEGSVMPKDVLQKILEKRKENQEKLTQMQMQADQINSALNQVMQEETNTSNDIETIANQGEMINSNMMGGSQNEVSSM